MLHSNSFISWSVIQSMQQNNDVIKFMKVNKNYKFQYKYSMTMLCFFTFPWHSWYYMYKTITIAVGFLSSMQ